MMMVHPRAAGSLHGGWRGEEQEPRSGAVPKVEKSGLTWAASNGGNLFILRERRAVGFGRRGDALDMFKKGWRIGLKGLLSSPAAGLAQLEVGLAMR
jgi:hypothetical protein